MRVSWTAKKTNECVLNRAGVKRELLDTVKARNLAYYGHRHTMRKQGSCLEKETMQGTMPGARRRGSLRTALGPTLSFPFSASPPLITSRRSGEAIAPPAGPGGARTSNAFFCANHSPKSANLLKVSPTCTRRPYTP